MRAQQWDSDPGESVGGSATSARPHWVESRGLYLDTMHLGPQGWDPQGR